MCVQAWRQPSGLQQANGKDQVVLGVHIRTKHLTVIRGYGNAYTQICLYPKTYHSENNDTDNHRYGWFLKWHQPQCFLQSTITSKWHYQLWHRLLDWTGGTHTLSQDTGHHSPPHPTPPNPQCNLTTSPVFSQRNSLLVLLIGLLNVTEEGSVDLLNLCLDIFGLKPSMSSWKQHCEEHHIAELWFRPYSNWWIYSRWKQGGKHPCVLLLSSPASH